jgi:urease accessory protein
MRALRAPPRDPPAPAASLPGNALLNLLTWLSPAFPVGSFAYSSGLEFAVDSGTVTTESTLQSWLEDSLEHGAIKTDSILLRRTMRGEDVADLAMTLATTAERRLETTATGTAFTLAAAAWGMTPDETPYPIALGRLARAQNISESDTILAFLHAATAAQISAAVRLIPLGQAAGLRVQHALIPAILTRAADEHATLGTAAWAADIAAMRHETQHTRLFRT